VFASIFLDFNLPNAATWFYFSLLLAVALFFKFSRLLAMRNWDVLTVFLLVPGLLLLQEGHAKPHNGTSVSPLVGYGYVWLLIGSGYFLVRCLIDLALVRRPTLAPNLNLSGLAWLGFALFAFLVVVAVRRPEVPEKVGRGSVALDRAQEAAAVVYDTTQPRVDPEERAATRFWVARSLAIACHLAIVAALILIGAFHFQDTTGGMGAACFYLLLPYTAIHIDQVHHVWPTALLLWAIFNYRRPVLAGLLLGLAAGSVFFPVLTFPIWFSFYRGGRGAARFTLAFVLAVALSLALTGAVLWWDGNLSNNLQLTFSLSDWQPWKVPATESIWSGAYWAYRMPVFVAYTAFVLMTFFWPAEKNLANVIALSAAVLIGIQFWYADQGGVYILWYLPLLLLLVFRPNLADRRPPVIRPETDCLAKAARWVRRQAARVLRFGPATPRKSEPVISFR
jgi:hypothetical protein